MPEEKPGEKELAAQLDEISKNIALASRADTAMRNARARGPSDPTSDQRVKATARKRMEEVNARKQKEDLESAVANVSEKDNPRLTNTPLGLLERRRQAIWAQREALGIKQRRPIYDKEGHDTGGKTGAV